MLGQIRKIHRTLAFAVLLASAAGLAGCASNTQNTALVKDPDAQKGDSMIPWNKQEKWENNPSLGSNGNITDRR
jgi:hypothetical protein